MSAKLQHRAAQRTSPQVAEPQKDLEDSSVDPGVQVAQAAPLLLDLYSMLGMVMGGCCTNVLTYEQLLKMNPAIGSALTFSQMLFISIHSLPSFLTFPSSSAVPHLKPRQVPLQRWAAQVAVLTAGSLLNNWAFAFKVPLTVQIVFRSAGLAVSMLFGRLVLKKQYSFLQVASVTLVSLGVVLATLSRTTGAAPATSAGHKTAEEMRQYALGVGMLVVSLFLTGILGILQEQTYKIYGPCWKEGVFYTHFLSLPVFAFLISDVKQGLQSLTTSPSASSSTFSYSPLLVLAANLLSQLICVSGVNRLTSQVSSVSTNLVLTTRKALSLCLSVWWFGNGWNWQLAAGAGMVFCGSFLFSSGAKPSSDSVQPAKAQGAKKE
ncbi:hypothetical protein HGRIS_005902 [Hohenbuehelia grisea]|uniref:UAA transporter n=1 Tax=Hohenbuehelia grisea TaxID=104357 RepID=A0ABR3K055_9AGAR